MFKRFISFLLLLAMLANLAAPLIGSLGGKEVCELAEGGSDKSEKEGKSVKELEKEAFGFFPESHFGLLDADFVEKGRKPIAPEDDRAVSQVFADSPERPPEA